MLDFNWTGDSATNVSSTKNNNTLSTIINLLSAAVDTDLGPKPYNLSDFKAPSRTLGDSERAIEGAIEGTISTLLGVVITDALSRTGYLDHFPLIDIGRPPQEPMMIVDGFDGSHTCPPKVPRTLLSDGQSRHTNTDMVSGALLLELDWHACPSTLRSSSVISFSSSFSLSVANTAGPLPGTTWIVS